MSFNSVEFLIFLPIVVLLYWIVPKKFRWILLLIASYLFYMSWNPWLIFLILFTTLVSYLSGIVMEKHKESRKLKVTFLVLTLVVCLGTLFVFKYLNFATNLVIDFINLFKSQKIGSFTYSLLLPVGISFYTFQTLSYVIDVYKGKIAPEKHLGYYALYVVYFPQLVAGPIERPENLLPQLKEAHHLSAEDFGTGLRIAAVGFIKKVVIADGVALFVDNVFNNVGSSTTGIGVLVATLLFAIQIYCDFSGYTDIAIGVSRLMGIKLCRNFDSPYKATSVRDFWRRWHISLSSWFRDYVYIPLGGSRCSFPRWTLNVMIVFLLSGLWHGAALTFVIWGGLHGLYQIIEKGMDVILQKHPLKHKMNAALSTWLKRIVTFVLVCFSWIFFRANSLGDAGTLIAKLFTGWGTSPITALADIGLNAYYVIKIGLSVVTLVMLGKVIDFDFTKQSGQMDNKYFARKMFYVYALLVISLSWLMLVVTGTESSFIYFQF